MYFKGSVSTHCGSESHAMNLKLNHDRRSSSKVLDTDIPIKRKTPNAIKEERRRNGRYIAILVGIMLFLLAIYHAWVRKIPIVASLVVPALIMFIYVGWVLYTASRDKHKLLDAEAAYHAAQQAAQRDALNDTQNHLEVTVVPSRETSKTTSPEATRKWADVSSALLNEVANKDKTLIKPVILINDEPHDDLDNKWTVIVENVLNNDKFKGFQTRRKKRRFCRSKRHAVFKRSYSIA